MHKEAVDHLTDLIGRGCDITLESEQFLRLE